MISEWMQVMLEEISRKKLEAQTAQIERERRAPETAAPVSKPAVASSERLAPRGAGKPK
jgi:hypothetical protein